MYNTTLVKEISLDTSNETGMAARILGLVSSKAHANIRSAWATGTNNQGHFSFITDNNAKAMEALKGEFPKCRESEVLVVNVKEGLGEIEKITNLLGKANLGINYIYTTYYDNQPSVILSTSDNRKAQTLFAH